MYVIDVDERNVNGGFGCGGVVSCKGWVCVVVVSV